MVKQKEDGSAIDYVVSLFVILAALFVFYFLLYEQKILVIKHILGEGLQSAENYILSDNGFRENDIKIDMDSERGHIITKCTEGAITPEEATQIVNLSDRYSERIKEAFGLNEYCIPTGNALSELCKGEILIKELIFYEPRYTDKDYDNIEGFYVFTIGFDNQNHRTNINKEWKTNLHYKGPTIISTVSCYITGPKSNIIADDDNNFFKNSSAIGSYYVEKTIKVDMVPARFDDRESTD